MIFNSCSKRRVRGLIWPKTPKMALISEYLAADSSPDASADALCIIDIGCVRLLRCSTLRHLVDIARLASQIRQVIDYGNYIKIETH